ncbi:MAG TPA: response regulator transcription factor [Methylomirabilota bacterium]|nr:response regulator transcription factor [Methylomirabilota bacterium]
MSEPEATIFVVDDDPSVRRGLERLLRTAGHRVESFASAREFLERPEHDGPRCLVLDVRMPGQSGLDLHDRLVASGRDIPVIFITGHADVPMAVRAMKAGAVDFLSKPFDDSELLGAARQALDRDRKRWTLRRRFGSDAF